MIDFFKNEFQFTKESFSRDIMIIGIGGGGDIITSFALGEYARSHYPVNIRYANTKRKYQFGEELSGLSITSYSDQLAHLLQDHLKIEKGLVEDHRICPDIIFCPESAKEEDALIQELHKLPVGEVWAVDTGGDAITASNVDFSSGRDAIMLGTLRKAFPNLKLFVVSPGSDGESTVEEIQNGFNQYCTYYLGYHPIDPLMPVFETYSHLFTKYRTPNIILDASRSTKGCSAEAIYRVPRKRHPDIPMKYLMNFFVFQLQLFNTYGVLE